MKKPMPTRIKFLSEEDVLSELVASARSNPITPAQADKLAKLASKAGTAIITIAPPRKKRKK